MSNLNSFEPCFMMLDELVNHVPSMRKRDKRRLHAVAQKFIDLTARELNISSNFDAIFNVDIRGEDQITVTSTDELLAYLPGYTYHQIRNLLRRHGNKISVPVDDTIITVTRVH